MNEDTYDNLGSLIRKVVKDADSLDLSDHALGACIVNYLRKELRLELGYE